MTAAARQARRRMREALGLAVYPVECGATVLNELEASALLRDWQIIDREMVAEALGKALLEWATEKQKSRVTQIARGRR